MSAYATAKAIIDGGTVDKLNDGYNSDDATKFRKQLIASARKVPTEDPNGLAKLVTNPSYTLLKHPGSLATTILKGDTSAIISKKTIEFNTKLESYNTEKGALDALKERIEKNVPESVLSELDDDEDGFANVSIEQMLNAVNKDAVTVDTLDVNDLLVETTKPVDFDGDVTLKSHFKEVDKAMKELKKNDVEQSEDVVMHTLLLQIEQEDVFDDDVIAKWKGRPKDQRTYDEFKKYWSEEDRKRREKNKLKKKTARDVGYDAANNTEEVETLVQGMVQSAMVDSMTQFVPQCQEVIHNTVAATANDEITKLRDQIKQLAATIETLKSDKKDTVSKKWFSCDYCGRKHPGNFPKDKCYLHPNNKDKSHADGGPPAGFTKKE